MYRRVETRDGEHRPKSRDVSPVPSDHRTPPEYATIMEGIGGEDLHLSLSTPAEAREIHNRTEHPIHANAGNAGKSTDSPSLKEEGASAQNEWTPGVWVRMPWLGLMAILGNISCILAFVVILVCSNNSEVKNWNTNLQPSVWLSAASTLANLSLGLALAEGLNIVFWREAIRGSSLNDLNTYASGGSLIGALLSFYGGNKNKKTLAVIAGIALTTLSTFRGPVIQRASVVSFTTIETSGNMTLNVAQYLEVREEPLGVTTGSSIDTTDATISYVTSNFSEIALNFTNRQGVYIDAPDCGDNCTTTVQGFGFKPTCIFNNASFDGQNSSIGSAGVIVFESAVNYRYNLSSSDVLPNTQFILNSTFLEGGLQSDVLPTQICTLDVAIVEYSVFISGNTVQMISTTVYDPYLPSSLSYIPAGFATSYLDGSSESGKSGTITAVGSIVAGFAYYLDSLFASSSVLSFQSFGETFEDLQNGNWSLQSIGINANQYMSLGTGWTITDNTTWSNPMSDMLNQTQELAFRVAVQTAINNPDPSHAQMVPYTGQRTITVYKSDYTVMGIAILINFLGLLSVLMLYHGWWDLGRRTSLSVLETAKAFGAPLLRDSDDNATAKQILSKIGKTRIMYGEVTSARSSGEFLIPRKGIRSRLQMVEEERGRRPSLGTVFG
ncbi:uncharacterized protein LY89DRAFT_723950 [Mollisia scopiformis]|uniref:Uncharacterized protein n=1 Tax=Mollisia scopiformis TaxID=149040 RepID=A0A132BCS0_MOLSC|nr:uncharacterized protein LY89DRAFT_723950 [Mollisia scopiformis]KUJ10178.1 hypothetical protein LY89DRAFT_723950 [Mollisia scopiformis]